MFGKEKLGTKLARGNLPKHWDLKTSTLQILPPSPNPTRWSLSLPPNRWSLSLPPNQESLWIPCSYTRGSWFFFPPKDFLLSHLLTLPDPYGRHPALNWSCSQTFLYLQLSYCTHMPFFVAISYPLYYTIYSRGGLTTQASSTCFMKGGGIVTGGRGRRNEAFRTGL